MQNLKMAQAAFYTSIYVGGIVFVNWLFSVTGPIMLPWGPTPPASLVVGFIFIFRDYAQRALGHYVVLPIFIAIGISYFMASPAIAFASAAAFGTGEIMDWLIYTITKKPFRTRILWSSAASVPVDSVLFLFLLNLLTPAAFFAMCLSKGVAAVLVWTAYWCGEVGKPRLQND